jgi:hypothetical protein
MDPAEVQSLKDRLAALERTVSPPAETAEQKATRLEAENASLRSQLAGGGRRALRFSDALLAGGPRADAMLDTAVAAVERSGSAPTLVGVLKERPGAMERFKSRVDDRKVSRADLEDDLSVVLNAAEADGLIRDGTDPLAASWA